MANITQDSLNIRLQKLICCIGTLGGEIQGMIAVGNDCYKEKLEKLKILVGYLNALECYSLDEPTLATGYIQLFGSFTGGSVDVSVNNISISGIYDMTNSSAAVEMTQLAAQINDYQSTYVAEYDVDTNRINITGTCNDQDLSVEEIDKTAWGSGAVGLTGGICVDNCLTEEQVLAMFDRVSKYCDICFPSAQYNFTDSLISTTPVE